MLKMKKKITCHKNNGPERVVSQPQHYLYVSYDDLRLTASRHRGRHLPDPLCVLTKKGGEEHPRGL
jgi:hypothetical protein